MTTTTITIPLGFYTGHLPSDYLQKVIFFSLHVEKAESLQRCFDQLARYPRDYNQDDDPDDTDRKYTINPNRRVALWKDFAPYSFNFSYQHRHTEKSDWITDVFGGIIFHGAHDGGGDGSFPTLSVSLTPVDGWSVHT